MKTNKFNVHEKILRYMDKIQSFNQIGKTLVVTELDLTNACNNKCPACIGQNTEQDELSWNEICQIAIGLKELDCKGIILSGGGEPLLHPQFAQTLRLLKEKGFKIGVNSNGLALNQAKAEAIAQTCEYFRISLDCGDAELYKLTHGMDEKTLSIVLENIRKMAAIKRELGSHLCLGTAFLTSKNTIGQMEAFVKLSKDCGVDFAQFRPFQDDMTDIRHEYVSLKDTYEDEFFSVLASRQKYDAIQQGKNKQYTQCRGMFFSTVVTANARIYACLHHRQDPQFLIGDMRQGKTLSQIWNSYCKWQVYESIDVQKCPAFCRNDAINRVLDVLSKDVYHQEFL